jgi:hypothetical protein
MTAPTRIRPARQTTHGHMRGRRNAATEPVFLDRTGRRHRIVAAAGAAATVLLSMLMLALLAGLTGVGAGDMPGWPAAGGHARSAQPVSPRTKPSSSAVRATATGRPSAPAPPPALTARPTNAAPAATTTSAPVAPTTSPTTRGNGHGKNASHTPNPHSSKKP